MASLGRRPLPPNHYLHGGPAIVFHFREPPPPRTIAPLDGAPTAEQLDEEGAWAEPRRRLKIRRMMAELNDRIRLEKELGHKIAPRVLDSRWDLPPPAPTTGAGPAGAPVPEPEAPGTAPQPPVSGVLEPATDDPLAEATDGVPPVPPSTDQAGD